MCASVCVCACVCRCECECGVNVCERALMRTPSVRRVERDGAQHSAGHRRQRTHAAADVDRVYKTSELAGWYEHTHTDTLYAARTNTQTHSTPHAQTHTHPHEPTQAVSRLSLHTIHTHTYAPHTHTHKHSGAHTHTYPALQRKGRAAPSLRSARAVDQAHWAGERQKL